MRVILVETSSSIDVGADEAGALGGGIENDASTEKLDTYESA
jgi:hypothetical protein